MGHPGGETRGLRHFGWAQTWWMMTHCRAGQVLCFAGLHQQAQRWLRRWTACSPYRMQVRAHVEDHAREAVVLGGLTLEGVQLEAPDSVQPEVLPRPLVLRRYHSQIDRRRSHGRQRSHPKETSVLMSRKSPGLGTRTSLATLPVCEDAVARMLIAANTSLHHGCNSRTHARAKSWAASSRLCQGCCTTFFGPSGVLMAAAGAGAGAGAAGVAAAPSNVSGFTIGADSSGQAAGGDRQRTEREQHRRAQFKSIGTDRGEVCAGVVAAAPALEGPCAESLTTTTHLSTQRHVKKFVQIRKQHRREAMMAKRRRAYVPPR